MKFLLLPRIKKGAMQMGYVTYDALFAFVVMLTSILALVISITKKK